MKLTAVILTKNEGNNIERCLKSVSFANEIILVDDFSIDSTVATASKSIKNIKVYKNDLKGDFAAQRNFGMKKASGDWILFIDADEIITSELQKEILEKLNNSKFDSYYLRRRDFFWGKELRFGELSKVRHIGLIRLIRKNSGIWMGDVHEVFHTAKKSGRLKNFVDHYPHPTIKEFLEDINFYSSLRANELFNQEKPINILEIIFVPILKFIYIYFVKLGFLDGPSGFTYSFMMTFHSFLVRAKLYQLKNL